MRNIFKLIEGLFMVVISVAFGSLFSGTIVYWIWPISIPSAFPGLVMNGTLSPELSWWSAVCLTWICGILLKASQTNNNTNK